MACFLSDPMVFLRRVTTVSHPPTPIITSTRQLRHLVVITGLLQITGVAVHHLLLIITGLLLEGFQTA